MNGVYNRDLSMFLNVRIFVVIFVFLFFVCVSSVRSVSHVIQKVYTNRSVMSAPTRRISLKPHRLALLDDFWTEAKVSHGNSIDVPLRTSTCWKV